MWIFGAFLSVIALFFSGAHAVAQNSGDEISVTISKNDCQRLVRHHPAPNVAYRPGVDVRGKSVVSADAGGRQALRLPDIYTFSVSRTIAGLPGGTEAEMAVGSIEYDINSGRMTFNGQPLADPMAEDVASRCQSHLDQGR